MTDESAPARIDDDFMLEVIQANEKSLFRFVFSLVRDDSLAHDVIQSAFIKLMQNGGEVEPAAIRSWLFRVAYNLAIERKRKQSLERRHMEKIAAWHGCQRSKPLIPNEQLIVDERRLEVTDAIERLPESQRTIVRLRIYDGLKFIEIAEQLNVPLGTVLTRMRTAMAKLKKAVEEFE